MAVASLRQHESGIRKAAIFLASLDTDAADMLLDQLDPDEAKLVRQAVMCLDDVDPAECRRVVGEFRRISPMVPRGDVCGIELDCLPASVNHRKIFATEPEKPVPFDFLRDAEIEKLADLLGGERPQTIAVVLSHLPPERAAEVLSYLPELLQVEVVRRLVDLENTDAEIVAGIEQALSARWSRQFAPKPERAEKTETAAKIIASCDGKIRGRILGNLASHDPTLAVQFGDRPLAFDDLATFSHAALLNIYRAAAPEIIQAALLGAPPEILERLLQCLPPAEANELQDQLNHPGPIRIRDIDEARLCIAELARRLAWEKSEAA